MGWERLALFLMIFVTVMAVLFIVGVILIAQGAKRSSTTANDQNTVPHTNPKSPSFYVGIGLISIPLSICAILVFNQISSQIDHARMETNCLWKVVENDNYERAKELLEDGVHPDCNDWSNGRNELDLLSVTPLYYATKNGNYELAELLLQYGADPNLRFGHVNSPIQCAIDFERPEILQLIINYGGDPNAHVSEDRDHPYLILAIENCDAVSAEILLRNGADPDAVNLMGYSALHLSESSAKNTSQLTEEERTECAEIVQLLETYLKNH